MLAFHIRYRVAPERADENAAAVAEFVATMAKEGDPGVSYTSYRLNETAFVHVAHFADEDAKARFQAHPAFAGFAAGLKDRAVDGPTATQIDVVATTTPL